MIAGHFHRAERRFLGDIPVYIAPPVVRWWGRQPSFRHWTVRGTKLSYRTIYV